MLPNDTLLGGLYLIRLSDTHYYGGRAFCFKNRWASHLKNLQEGTANRYMQNVYNLYGRFEPEILVVLPREECIAAEQAWLDEHFRKPGCVNLNHSACGGDGDRRVRFGTPNQMRPENITSGDWRLGLSKEKKFSVGLEILYPMMRATDISEVRSRELQKLQEFLSSPDSWADLAEGLDVVGQAGNILILHISYSEM